MRDVDRILPVFQREAFGIAHVAIVVIIGKLGGTVEAKYEQIDASLK